MKKKTRRIKSDMSENFHEEEMEIVEEVEDIIEIEDGIKTKRIKRLPLIINIFKRLKKKNNNLVISSFCLIKILGTEEHEVNELKIKIGEDIYDIHFLFKHGIRFIKNYRFNFYKMTISLDQLINMDIQNKLQVVYKDFNYGRILYSVFDYKNGKNRNSKIIIHNGRAIFLRQSVKNTAYITVREITPYDNIKGTMKLRLAWVLSKLMFFKRDFILLFEKECSRYEESASVLYEKLIDKGYKNVYYIIDKENIKYPEIKDKYKHNIIFKNSMKHLVYFFKCKKFVGTEALGHAVQLRIANKLVKDKLASKDIMYVFLQHGVMYMVSLSSDLRTGFKKMDIKLHKIVTSSEEEAKHFIDLGGFERKDLYVCGLPKFDTAVRNENSDKIVIMPTWRRWEANEASINYENTKYYKMIKRIVSAIPDNLQDKIIILPHPLMLKEIKNSKDYKNYIPNGDFTYDEILKDCRLLITDYSSIAYDAYFRGSNVIFYWEEKDECMEQYGEKAKLMLNEKNVFADVCYNKKELISIIEKNYYEEQNPKNKKKYKKIVQFDDRKNTERLIKMLIKDGVLK